MDRRFEVFVSSTKIDLEDQRRYMRDAIVAAGHIPVGMERFPDGHEPQWDAISRAIDACDAYVLILGARYGTVDETGKAFTHREYLYALSLGKPVLVFCLTASGASAWPMRDDPESADEREREQAGRLLAFRNEVLNRLVHLWSTAAQFEDLVDRNLAGWIERVGQHGWVRWNRFSLIASQRDVYTYLFNNLTPYRRVAFAEPFLQHLDEPLDSMDAVLLMLTVLMKEFLAPRLPAHVRLYFAYRLSRTRPMPRDGGRGGAIKAYYAFGTTVQRRDLQRDRGQLVEDPWTPGFLVGRESNLDRAYTSGQIRCVADATHASRAKEDANQLVQGEGSVLSIPILFARGSTAGRHSPFPIGVLGMSSPEREELAREEFQRFAQEVQTVVSSLFYAHALAAQSKLPSAVTQSTMATRIRREIARHFEETLA